MRVLRTLLGGLFLVGMAVAVVVLVFGQGGATPAAAQPLDPHYKCYSIPPPQPAVNETVSLRTDFGLESTVQVTTPSSLCLPAGKNQAPIPQGAPWLKCYNVVAGPPTPARLVSLTTQFGGERPVEVGPAQELCVPAGIAPGPLPPATPDYKCYSISGTAPQVSPVRLDTVLTGTEEDVVVGTPARLCMPAGMNGAQVPAGVVPLKCYNIADPAPGETVNLQTVEFPPENGIVLGPAVRLCAPALLGSVGGVADLAPGAGASEGAAASTGGSGWSAGAYAALAGGLAAAAIVIVGGGWFARRRFTKS